MNLSIVTLPYNVQGKNIGGGAGPKTLLEAQLVEQLRLNGHVITAPLTVEMTAEEEKAYGGWRRVGKANSYLAQIVNMERDKGRFILGLLANCNGLAGMLGGLQHNAQEPKRPKRVGLVWIDAHGDYNTPDTSPSGMLGGMPVAVAAGKCLPSLRHQSGLRFPLQSPDIVMMGLRDLDAEERKMIEADDISCLTEYDLISQSKKITEAMCYLSSREDIIYVHVDLDILDPSCAPAAGLPTPGGLTGQQLGDVLRLLLRFPKVQALSMVSFKPSRDNETQSSLHEIMQAIKLGLKGVLDRK